jgi:hypothetical protein
LGAGAPARAQDRWGDRDGYGRYDRRGGGPAYSRGFEDGRWDGERDLRTGHSFRPTHSDNYRHADRGYRHEFGERQYYKDQYRAGYLEGYRMAFGGRR